MRFAMGIVVEADEANEVWEDVSATLGDSNNLLEEGHSCVFVGGPHRIAEQDEYDSEEVAEAIQAGVTAEKDDSEVEAGDMSRSDGLGAETRTTIEGAYTADQVAAGFNVALEMSAYLNEREEWNGGDVCELLAAKLKDAGFPVD